MLVSTPTLLTEKQYSSAVYDSRIIEELYNVKPDNGLRGIYQLLKQHDLTKPLTLEKWRNAIKFNLNGTVCFIKSHHKICAQELSKRVTFRREHVLKEIERSFSLNDEPEVVEELTALSELEVLEAAGALIRPLKKRIKSWLVLVDICPVSNY